VPAVTPTRGEGVVVGILDSGANIVSPSLSATDVDGYTHINPLPGGDFLGWCNPSNPNHNPARDICNSKMIGGWDYTDNLATTNFEAAGFEDENGHGTHTASTAAGNKRTATIFGTPFEISGVAPRANVVIYDVCYTNSGLQGLCPTAATTAAINQVVADGVVDVINYSIGGGTTPWSEAGSLAFLAAQNAGVFVSAAAGNGTPTPGTTNHQSPWVMTVGASTHTRGTIGNAFTLTNPPSAPPSTQDFILQPGAAPPYISAPVPGTTPVILSPQFGDGTANADGCSDFAPNTFTRSGVGAIALIRWGTAASPAGCGTIARVNRAATAGAAGVIFLADTPLSAAAGGTVPAWVINDTTVGTAIRNHIATNPSIATASIAFPGQGSAGQGDVMATFSLLGPATFDVIKPDITAPGVQILAGLARWNLVLPFPGSLNTSLNNNAGLLSGTSMAAPHVAGAAALIKALRPSWTPSEIKSALVTTAKTANVFKPTPTPPSVLTDPFDRGGGRVDLGRAALAGLVQNETGANFQAANPTNGGQPWNLNMPSLQRGRCAASCTFTRTFRSVAAATTTWNASVVGLPAGAANVSPSSFTLDPDQTQVVTVTINGGSLSQTTFSFGELVLAPNSTQVVEQRLPVAVRGVPPDIDVSATGGIDLVIQPGQDGAASFTIANQGSPTINWSIVNTNQVAPALAQTTALNNGYQSARYAARTPPNTGFYVADDFVIGPATLSSLRADGFVLPGGNNLNTTNSPTITFDIYADRNGFPAGSPEGLGAPPVWTATVAANAAGLTLTGNNIQLNLATAGLTPPNLPGGRYWVVVYPNMIGNGSNTAGNPIWAWRLTGVGAPTTGRPPVQITPSAAGASWAVPQLSAAPGPGPAAGFTLSVNVNANCSQPAWLATSAASGTVNTGSQQIDLTLNTASLAPGVYAANVCVSSNDTDEPMTFVPIRVRVTDELFSDGYE
jgi:subtilisin family serine protease